jgi:chloramphenicol 3-O phosphotransferase
MAKGKVILLNGASSAGKTSIARALQRALETPFLCAGIDTFVPMLDIERYVAIDPPEGALARQGFYLKTVKHEDLPCLEINTGPIAHRFIAGMHLAIAGLASAGNHLIFEDVIYDQRYLKSYVTVLRDFYVLFVGVRCPLEVLEQRERGRRAPGHARGHYALVHAHGLYDIEVDTSVSSPEECAQQIIHRLYDGPAPDTFHQLRRKWEHEGWEPTL